MRSDIILETERLYFRPHILADLDAYCLMEADPDFRRYVGGRPRPREEAESKFMHGLQQLIIDNLSMWATVYKPENKYIGRCGVYPHFNSESKPIAGEGAFGVYLDKAFWNRGLAIEAGRAFVDFGLNQLRLKRIVTAIDSRNEASIHVIQKIGFKLSWIEEGHPRSFYHYVLEQQALNLAP